MIIHDGDIGGPAIRPAEDDTPLVVDADGVQTGCLSLERFKPVSRWDGEIWKDSGAVHLNEFAKGGAGDGVETPVGFRFEELFSVWVCKS